MWLLQTSNGETAITYSTQKQRRLHATRHRSPYTLATPTRAAPRAPTRTNHIKHGRFHIEHAPYGQIRLQLRIGAQLLRHIYDIRQWSCRRCYVGKKNDRYSSDAAMEPPPNPSLVFLLRRSLPGGIIVHSVYVHVPTFSTHRKKKCSA